MIEAGYYLLFFAIVVIVLAGYNSVLQKLSVDKSNRIKKVGFVGGAIALWTIYVFVLSATGFLQNFELPPRFPIFLIFPLFIFTGVFLYRNRNSEVIKALPKSWAIYFQTFRIFIELLFIGSVAQGVLHPEVTFHGYNYDIIFASTAPIIAFLAFQKKIISEKIVLIWNFVGLAVIAKIIFLFFSTVFFPSVWGSASPLINEEFATIPYTFIPGFLMPIAVFMHVLSIIQLSKKDLVE